MWSLKKGFFLLVLVGLASGDVGRKKGRGGRQNQLVVGIDFTGCQTDPSTGFCCIEKEEEVTSIQKDPILECTHKNVEKCHYTYVTRFDAAQEEVCDENFEKSCQVTFKQQAFNETVKKCYSPVIKICDGSGPNECKTVYESSCSTHYIEKQPGKFVGDTKCEKLPIEVCGAGCVTEEGPEECHDKVIQSLLDVPEETCDLNPQKVCKFVTKLVPKLHPKPECTLIPQESCQLKFSQPQQVPKPLLTRWCQDPNSIEDDNTYQEGPDTPPLIQQGTSPVATFDNPPPYIDEPRVPPPPPPRKPQQPPKPANAPPPPPIPVSAPPPPPRPQPQQPQNVYQSQPQQPQNVFQSQPQGQPRPPPPPPPPAPSGQPTYQPQFQQQFPSTLYGAPPPAPRVGRQLAQPNHPPQVANRRFKP